MKFQIKRGNQIVKIADLNQEWIEEYKDNFVDARQLLKEIDEYMKSYDELKEKVIIILDNVIQN